jgi:hypothetical protein
MDNWHNNAKEPEKRCRYMVLGSVFAVGLGSPDTFKRYHDGLLPVEFLHFNV